MPTSPAMPQAPAAPGASTTPSGMLRAGTILLLVGAILHTVGAFFMAVGGTVLLVLGRNLVGEGDSAFGATLVGAIYLALAVLLAAGAVLGFSAWRRAQRGEYRSAWIRGLVASLLPPLQVVALLGAIFVLVSPEGSAASQGRAGQAPPQAR